MTKLTAIISRSICQSRKFETGAGTCALRCCDQLGDARRRPCEHSEHIHSDLATRIAIDLQNAGLTKEN